MTDTTEDLLIPLGVKLNIPLFLGEGGQMEGSEIETQQIALLHIHIEKAVRYVKEFDMLSDVIPASVSASANQIWTVLSIDYNPLITC